MATIWLTGASSGIGKAVFQALLADGHTLLITGRNASVLQQLANDHHNVKVLAADLTDEADRQAVQHQLEQWNQPIDTVIVNAGSCEYMDQGELDITSMQRVFSINTFAAAATIDLALPYLKLASSPHIVGISSLSVFLPFQRAEYYGASKAALNYYLQSLAMDLADIDVSLVYPGFVKTPLTDKNDFPMPFIMSPEQAASHVLKVLKKRPRHYAFPKRLYYVLKLMAATPWLWRYLHQSRGTRLTQENTL